MKPAADQDKETKEKAVERIEVGMSYCPDCTTTNSDNHRDMCQKHLRMYGRLYP